jgi:predicted cobalt transporter CbtA
MLGSMWLPTYPLVLPATLSIMAMCATTGAGIGLHALAAVRRSLRTVIIGSVHVVAGALVGAKAADTLGTMRYGSAR